MKNLSKEELLSRIEAINRSNALIYFDLNGFILGVNSIFLTTMGYKEDEHEKVVETLSISRQLIIQYLMKMAL